VTVNITGLSDLNEVLRTIAPREGINLMRATVQDIAAQLAKTAKQRAPDDPTTGAPDLKTGIKAKRDKTTRDSVSSSVRVYKAFYWRFLEYGQGPDGVEHAFFLKSLEEMRPNMDRVYMQAFGKKLAARLARERKRSGL
jgi:HK97 gp10 family phage protein